MAEEIVYKVDVDASGAEETLGSLKKKAQEAREEIEKVPTGSARFKELQADIKATEGRVGELEEGLKALNPEQTADAFLKSAEGIAGAFAVATGAMALFGVESEEVEQALLKVQAATAIAQGVKMLTEGIQGMTVAFRALSAAILANPLALIIGAIVVAISAALYAIYNFRTIILKAFDDMGVGFRIALAVMTGGISEVIRGLAMLAEYIGGTQKEMTALEKQQQAAREATRKANIEAIKGYQEQIKAVQALRAEVEKRYDREIQLAEASGRDTVAIERKKLDAIRQLLQEELRLRQATAQKAREILTSEFTKGFAQVYDKQAEQTAKALEEQEFQIELFETKQRAKASEAAKKRAEDDAKAMEEDRKRNQEFLDAERVRYVTHLAEKLIANEEFAEKNIAISTAEADALLAAQAERDAQELAAQEAKNALKEQLSTQSFDALRNIGELFIKDQDKLDKFNKAIAISQLAVDTAKAISATIAGAAQAAAAGGPAAPFLLASYITSGIATVLAAAVSAKKILGEAGGVTPPSLGGGGGGAVNTPNLGTQNQIGSTQLDRAAIESGQSNPIKVYVTETDISDKQRGVSNMVAKATVQ
jgi:hypothetical protein